MLNENAQRQSLQQQAAQREAARSIAERVNHLAEWRDWSIDWSGNGSIADIIKRWSAQSLQDAFKKDANVDLSHTISSLSQSVTRLRESLAKDGVDRHNTSAPTELSQKAIALKQRRHALNESLSTLRIQKEQTDELLSSLDHRIQSASDLLRFKTTGIGRLDHIECPTCHRDLDPGTFALTNQSAQSVGAHIESLKRDREMMATNGHSIDIGISTTRGSLQALDVELREAERALMSVTAASGAEREQIAKIVAELASLERQIDRAREAMAVEIEGHEWDNMPTWEQRDKVIGFAALQASEVARLTAALKIAASDICRLTCDGAGHQYCCVAANEALSGSREHLDKMLADARREGAAAENDRWAETVGPKRAAEFSARADALWSGVASVPQKADFREGK